VILAEAEREIKETVAIKHVNVRAEVKALARGGAS